MTDSIRPTGQPGGLSRTLDIMDRSRSRGITRLVLFALADNTDGDGWATVTMHTLQFANCTPDEADDAIGELVLAKEVEWRMDDGAVRFLL